MTFPVFLNFTVSVTSISNSFSLEIMTRKISLLPIFSVFSRALCPWSFRAPSGFARMIQYPSSRGWTLSDFQSFRPFFKIRYFGMIFCDFFMNLSNISPETTTDLSITARQKFSDRTGEMFENYKKLTKK